MDSRFGEWVDAYALPLVRWAMSKTGSSHQAEELAQEVWLQFFSAVQREEAQGRAVLQPEHFLRRIAKYVWCKQLRRETHRPALALLPLAEPDFAQTFADADEQQRLTAWLHRRIVQLSRTQREIMILYYIDQLPQKAIAQRLGITEGAVRWHLFDTRRKLREEHQTMPQHTADYVYRPGRLHMAVCGTPVPELDIKRINQSLLMQNILLHCYRQGRTVQEIAAALGVAAAYVENDLQWLTAQEFVTEEKGRYATAFLIHDSHHRNDVCQVFFDHQQSVSLAIVRYLTEHEAAIRALGFTGCDKPMDRLLWLLLYHFTYYLPLPLEKPTPPLRPDGGRYNPLGFDRSHRPRQRLDDGWDCNGSMEHHGFCWFGLYHFGSSEIEDLLDSYTPEWNALRLLLEKLIRHGFDLACVTDEEQYRLAQLVEKGFVLVHNGQAQPNFVIFDQKQYDQLQKEIFQPLATALQPALQRVAEDLHRLSLRTLPRHLHRLAPLDEVLALMDIGFMTELIAFKAGYLYEPKDQRDGEFLTMCYLAP